MLGVSLLLLCWKILIRKNVMTMIVVRIDYVRKWAVDYEPNIIAKIEKEKKSTKWHVEWNGASTHEVY